MDEKRTVGMVSQTETMVRAALFIGIGLIMPMITGQIPEIGSKLLPMHLPVLLCGYVCGWRYGLIVGFVVPLLRSVTFGMPSLMPGAAAMAFELAAYGAVTGFLYRKLPSGMPSVYISLIGAMLIGRVVWGVASTCLYGVMGKAFSVQLFIANGFVGAIPGIILQLVLIPAVVAALKKANVME